MGQLELARPGSDAAMRTTGPARGQHNSCGSTSAITTLRRLSLGAVNVFEKGSKQPRRPFAPTFVTAWRTSMVPSDAPNGYLRLTDERP
jgi:hypothetical protein